MKKNIIYIALLLGLASCGSKQQHVVSSMTAERILVGTTNKPDNALTALVGTYKKQLDKEMNIVIGTSLQAMPFAKPESLLTNLTSDVMRQLDKTHTDGKAIDVAVMNVNGHRAAMPKGDITVGDVFEIYSFDNTLTIVELKGSDLTELFRNYAKMGGSGISSNVKLVVSKSGQLIEAKVNGDVVDDNKIYNIVTLDYLADGNDGMDAFKKALSVKQSGIILRDYMMDYVKSETAKGKPISSNLDGRIIVQ